MNNYSLVKKIYQAIGLSANNQGIINQALATSRVVDIINKKMYNEEEIIDLIQFLSTNQDFNGYSSVSKDTAKYYLEQFKNKS